jgi:tRNA-specific 2-thiouridylase
MPTDELESIRFPLGHLDKDAVRERAAAYDLPNAHKKDSQEICFVPDGDYAGFVETAAKARGRRLPIAGDIVDVEGTVLAQHGGIHKFTVGQRRGLGDVATGGDPVYVVRIDRAANRVVVGPRADAASEIMTVGDVRWFGPAPGGPVEAAVQVRYRATPAPAIVTGDGDTATIEFRGPPQIASPGQAAVFYRGDTVLGGGWITR